MHIQIPHNFSKAEAVQRVKRALDEGRPQMQGKVAIEKEEWAEDVLHFAFTGQGQNISGSLEVKDKELVIDAKLPLCCGFSRVK